MKERPKNEPPQFLSGWKEIANYLRKGVRTVQRYEHLFMLPVRRPAGKPWGSVLATKAELDAWVKAIPIREEFPLRDAHLEYAVQARDIRTGLKEMERLRDQMFALRAEVHKSVETLSGSVVALQKEMSRNWWKSRVPMPHDASLVTAKESELLAESAAELRSTPVKYPKAS